MERCPQPVVAAIHGACVGAAVDLVCACDVRICSEDASFCIAEVKVGLAADVGTLQRMPKVTSYFVWRGGGGRNFVARAPRLKPADAEIFASRKIIRGTTSACRYLVAKVC